MSSSVDSSSSEAAEPSARVTWMVALSFETMERNVSFFIA